MVAPCLAGCVEPRRWFSLRLLQAVQVTSDAVFINDRAVANGTAVSSVFTFNLGIVAVHEVSHG